MSASIIATIGLGFGASSLFVRTLMLMPEARRVGPVDRPGGPGPHDGAVPSLGTRLKP